MFRGSRIVDLWKGKGDGMQCDLRWGLSIPDHVTKTFLLPVKHALEPFYRSNMPVSQLGGVSDGGTDFASHIILEVMNYARVHDSCLFVLFLDLGKAFDKVIRELVFGFPLYISSQDDKIKYLQSVGVHMDDAIWICE